MDVAALSPQHTERFIGQQMARWGKVVKDNNIRVE
jgi:hypothetical protein